MTAAPRFFSRPALAGLALVLAMTAVHAAPAAAQETDEQRAFQTYQSAREAFHGGDFDRAIQLLDRTRQLLGATNIRIQPMLVRALYQVEDWGRAREEVAKYHELQPDRGLAEYTEIVQLSAEIERRIAQDEAAHENAWDQAKSGHTVAAYTDYVDRYPDGAHVTQARERIERLDREAYERATRTGTQDALNAYLRDYPLGAYRSEARAALALRVDDDAFASARSTNTVAAFQGYLRQYPTGRNAAAAHTIIGNTYRAAGDNAVEASAWSNAVDAYEAYLSSYPSGPHSSEVQGKLAKARRQLHIARLPDHGFLAWHGAPTMQIGLSFGSLKNRGTGMLLALRTNPHVQRLAEEPGYTVNDNGDLDGDVPGPLYGSGEEVTAEAEALLGLTRRLLPDLLWAYAAGGAGYYADFLEAGEDSGGNFGDDAIWIRNTDQTRFGWVAEAGLALRLGPLVLTGGYATRQVEENTVSFGVGIGM